MDRQIKCVKMIDPKELRLGNLVLEAGEPSHIYSISSGGISFYTINGINVNKETGCTLNGGEERFKPIPITYELLLQLGFIDPAKNGWGCRISVNSMDEICWYRQDETVRYQTKLSGFTRELNIKYIHQLQNAYYVLTGEELTVKEKA